MFKRYRIARAIFYLTRLLIAAIRLLERRSPHSVAKTMK